MLKRSTSFLFSLPALLLYSTFVIFPLLLGLYLSLTEFTGYSASYKLIGFANYARVLADPEFWFSVKITCIFTLIFALSQNLGALVLAFLLELTMRRWVSRAVRTLVYLPNVLSRVIVGIMWYYILKIGLPTLFELFGLKGLAGVEWIGTQWSLYSIILVSTWLYTGTALIIYLTSLESISTELFEAASIDGASRFRSFWHISIPLIVPAFLVNFILSIILGFQQFDQILTMTRGGPGNATTTLTYSIYNKAYLSIDGGYATAEAYALFLLVMVISLLIIRFFRTKEVQA